MSQKIQFFFLGGLDETGKNLLVVEIDDNIFVVDAGLKYPENVNSGIDLVIPNCSYLFENSSRIKAYFITCGNEYMFGSLPYIYEKAPAPVYCGKVTQEIIKSYVKRNSLQINFDFQDITFRKFITIAGIRFLPIKSTSSISDSYILSIETSLGHIVYSSDFLFDFNAPTVYKSDIRDLASLSKLNVVALLCSSTGAKFPGHSSPNNRLTPLIKHFFGENKRIIIGVYNQNLYAIREIVDLCIATNKKIYFYSDTLFELIKTIYKLTGTEIVPESILAKKSGIHSPNTVILVTANIPQLYKSMNHVVTESKTVGKVTSNDIVIFASTTTFANELDAETAKDSAARSGAKVEFITYKNLNHLYAYQEDISLLINLIKPTYLIPMKGTYTSLFACKTIAKQQLKNPDNCFMIASGDLVSLNAHGYKLTKEYVQAGDIFVSGKNVDLIKKQALVERDRLANEGVITLSIVFDSKKKEILSVKHETVGLSIPDESTAIKELIDFYIDFIEANFKSESITWPSVETNFFDFATNYIKQKYKQNPIFISSLIDIYG